MLANYVSRYYNMIAHNFAFRLVLNLLMDPSVIPFIEFDRLMDDNFVISSLLFLINASFLLRNKNLWAILWMKHIVKLTLIRPSLPFKLSTFKFYFIIQVVSRPAQEPLVLNPRDT